MTVLLNNNAQKDWIFLTPAQFLFFVSNDVINHTTLWMQDMQMPFYSSLLYQFPYPSLELEDFPQINIAECVKPSKPEISDEYMMYKDCMDGTLEQLCSSQDNSSIVLPHARLI